MVIFKFIGQHHGLTAGFFARRKSEAIVPKRLFEIRHASSIAARNARMVAGSCGARSIARNRWSASTRSAGDRPCSQTRAGFCSQYVRSEMAFPISQTNQGIPPCRAGTPCCKTLPTRLLNREPEPTRWAAESCWKPLVGWKTQLAAPVQVSLALSRSATDPNCIQIAVCLKSIQWPMCQGPICSVSASAFSLVASRPTPKIPPTTGTVITHSSKFVIWLVLYTVRDHRFTECPMPNVKNSS